MFATADSSQKTEESLRIFLGRGSFAELITRLENSLEQLPEDKAMGLAKALINIGDDLPRQLSLFLDDVIRSRWLFEKIVMGIVRGPQGHSLVGLLLELLSGSTGVIIPALFCNDLSEALSKADSAIAQLIDAEQVQQFSRGVVAKIIGLAHEGKLKDHLHSASLVYFWKRWGNSEEIKAWINSVINDQSGLFWFLKLVSQTADFEDPALPQNPYRFKIDLVEQFVDLANLQSRIQTFKSEPLQEQERKLEQAISLALKEWNARQERKGLAEDPAK